MGGQTLLRCHLATDNVERERGSERETERERGDGVYLLPPPSNQGEGTEPRSRH